MGLQEFAFSAPRRFSLPLAAAFGMALGFYPGANFLLPSMAFAIGIASLGHVIGGSGWRLRSLQALALGLGLAAGAAVAWSEAGRAAPRAPAPSEVSADRGGGFIPLRPAWAEGRLSSDSTPAKNGFRSYPLEIARLGLAGDGVSAELSYPGRGRGEGLRVLARAGQEIDSGSLIRARGSFSEGSGGAALFALPRELAIIDRGGPLDRGRSSVRDACRKALARIGTSSSGLMQALILGVRDSLSPEEANAFKAAGCSHILALSGEHLSVLAVLAITALKPLFGPTRARLGGAILASLFMCVAGPGPSLLRSVLMVWIGAIALALDRPQDWLTSLALAFLLMIPMDPGGGRSLSFTLSYLAVWGLAVLGPRFSFLLGRILPPFLCESASASLAAQAAVSPLLAFSFGYLQFAGILASMAAGPIVSLMMYWGMGAALLCSIFPFAIPLVVPVSDALYSILMAIMNAAAAVPALPLASPAAQSLASLAIAAIAALVYARPYAEYRAGRSARKPSRLQFTASAEDPPREGGPGHDQALRPEFSG
jgi:ComEC/Rec2-related protein